MPGTLTHSPADVLASALVALGLGSATVTADWAVFVGNEPDEPERCITCYDDVGILHGRVMQGETQEHHAVQVRVRAEDHPNGYTKARAICTALDAQYDTTISISGHNYLLHCCNRSGDVISLKLPTVSERNLFTINYLLSLREV